jgi:hypothetical protein
MSKLVSATNISEGWLAGLEALISANGHLVNLVVTISNPLDEDVKIRGPLDAFLDERRGWKVQPSVERVSTVANTIFPQALYRSELGSKARRHLYEMTLMAKPVSRRRNRSGTYFERMVAWPGPNGFVNQLDQAITRLKRDKKKGRRRGNIYEIGVSTPDGDDRFEPIDIPVYSAGLDNRTRGFPCLSHISLTLFSGALHMTAVYRNHEFIRRAYGNYLGLGRLLNFLAAESGWVVGELTCVSSHATAEFGSSRGFGKTVIKKLSDACRLASEMESAS